MDMIEFTSGYFVNRNGEIFNNKTGEMKKVNSSDRNGYRVVSINVDGKSKGHLIHRIVAEAFLPNPDHKPIVNHKDGNKSNNCVDNLEWCTFSENIQHAWDTGLIKQKSNTTESTKTDPTEKMIEETISEYRKKENEKLEKEIEGLKAELKTLLFCLDKLSAEKKIIVCFILKAIKKMHDNQFSDEQVAIISKLLWHCLSEWDSIHEESEIRPV